MELCPALGISVPVGKDSLSMRTRWRRRRASEAGHLAGEPDRHAPSPRLADVRGTLDAAAAAAATRRWCWSTSARAAMRMGGSMLAQVLGQFGDEVPDLDDPALLKALVEAVNALRAAGPAARLPRPQRRRPAGPRPARWRSPATCGVSLNVDLLVTEGDGIADSRAEYGDSKNWAAQVERAARRADAAGAVQRGARRRAPGAAPHARDEVMQRAARRTASARHSHVVGKTQRRAASDARCWRDAKAVFSAPLRDLHQAWDEVSWRICRLRDNPACADAEHAAAGRERRPGPARRT